MIELKTEHEYATARMKIDAYQQVADAYMKEHKTNGIPADVYKTFPYANEVSNDLRSAVEVWEFMHNPPIKYTAYVDKETRNITTWTGQKLGTILSVKDGRQYKRIGRTRILSVHGINGRRYRVVYYYDDGDYCYMIKEKA